jgi:hypothetical protein
MLVLASIATLFARQALYLDSAKPVKFPSRSLASLRNIISRRGVAKKRREEEVAAATTKCSLSVAKTQHPWRYGNHF